MALRDIPIKQKIMRVILITSGSVLFLTCSAYFAYEVITYRQTSIRQLSILGKIIAANSTAALAFDSHGDAFEILNSLKAHPHIETACLYDKEGRIFSVYPEDVPDSALPERAEDEGYRFSNASLIGFQPIVEGDVRLGTLYIRSDIRAIYQRMQLYGTIVVLLIILSIVLAYLLSARLQEGITRPILNLTDVARVVSERQDYSVRAVKSGNDEVGLLTEAFNNMLTHIEAQNREIQQFNHGLEQKIAERTSQLEMVNKELESFSYSVSHDLRAPLRSIDGYAKMFLKKYQETLDEKGRHFLNVITDSALKMGQLIDDLLTFSRVGKTNLRKVPLDMTNIISTVIEEQKDLYSSEVKINMKEMLPIEGDSSMLKQVMINLISNALKYSMKKEKPVIEIGSFMEKKDTIYYVKDNGAGFDMRYYDKLFGVFQRLHGDDEFEGTGVGLALVHRIVSKHGGKVWGEGKVDEGSVFYFSLSNRNDVVSNTNQNQML